MKHLVSLAITLFSVLTLAQVTPPHYVSHITVYSCNLTDYRVKFFVDFVVYPYVPDHNWLLEISKVEVYRKSYLVEQHDKTQIKNTPLDRSDENPSFSLYEGVISNADLIGSRVLLWEDGLGENRLFTFSFNNRTYSRMNCDVNAGKTF